MATPTPDDPVSAIMSTRIVTAKKTDKMSTVLRTMVKSKVGSVVVVDKGKPIGIITERDITRMVAKGKNVRSMTVQKAMSKHPVTIPRSEEVADAVVAMLRKDIRRLPVMEGEKLVGMVTERDIMHWLVKVAYAPNVPADLTKLLEVRALAHTVVA